MATINQMRQRLGYSKIQGAEKRKSMYGILDADFMHQYFSAKKRGAVHLPTYFDLYFTSKRIIESEGGWCL